MFLKYPFPAKKVLGKCWPVVQNGRLKRGFCSNVFYAVCNNIHLFVPS